MNRVLLVDIGAGTMDVLYYEMESGIHYKAGSKSPVLTIAERVDEVTGKLLITGNEMGGGPISQVLEQRAREAEALLDSI